MQLSPEGRTKGRLISQLSITILTIINQEMLALLTVWQRPALNQLQLCTVLQFLHWSTPVWLRCVRSQFAYYLDSIKHRGVLPGSGLLAEGLTHCLLSVTIRWSPFADWILSYFNANSLYYATAAPNQHNELFDSIKSVQCSCHLSDFSFTVYSSHHFIWHI